MLPRVCQEWVRRGWRWPWTTATTSASLTISRPALAVAPGIVSRKWWSKPIESMYYFGISMYILYNEVYHIVFITHWLKLGCTSKQVAEEAWFCDLRGSKCPWPGQNHSGKVACRLPKNHGTKKFWNLTHIEAPQNLKTQAERDLAPKALLQLCFKVFRKRQIELYYGFHTFSLGFCIEG